MKKQYKDKEKGESKKHEKSESKSFEKKEDKGTVKDSADKKQSPFEKFIAKKGKK